MRRYEFGDYPESGPELVTLVAIVAALDRPLDDLPPQTRAEINTLSGLILRP